MTGRRVPRTPERRAAVAEAVAELAQRALQAAQPQDLLREALTIAVTVVGADYGTALRRLPNGGMQVAGELGPDPIPAGTTLPIAPAKSYSLEVATSGQPFLSDDLRTDPRITPPASLLERGVVSGLAVPILGPRGVLGVLALHSSQRGRYGPDEVADAVALAGVVSTAWEQAEHVELLNHQAMHDPLTGLANRALFFDRLHRALDRRPPGPFDHPQAGGSVAVMLVDLDDFKAVNDTHGHAAGDQVLVTAAHRLSEAVRPQDTVARIGGDEFALLCEHLPDDDTALGLGWRVQAACAHQLTLPTPPVTITASVGLALGHPGRSEPAEDILGHADAALYQAKEHTGGRLHVFDAARAIAAGAPTAWADLPPAGRIHGPARVDLPPDPAAARTGRRFILDCCQQWHLDLLGETAELLTAELVTNAVVHARSEVTLTARQDQHGLLVEVDDLDSRPAHYTPASTDALGGRGLVLVDALADTWGTIPSPSGKTIWFRLKTNHF